MALSQGSLQKQTDALRADADARRADPVEVIVSSDTFTDAVSLLGLSRSPFLLASATQVSLSLSLFLSRALSLSRALFLSLSLFRSLLSSSPLLSQP